MRPAVNGGNRGASGQQPSKFAPLKPVQLGSIKSENEGQDKGVQLVPAGGGGWGRRSKDGEAQEAKKEEASTAQAPKSKLGGSSPSLASKPAVLAPGGQLWSAVVAAPAPPRKSREEIRQEEEFPSLGRVPSKEPDKTRERKRWADEEVEFDLYAKFPRPSAGRLTDCSIAKSLRPTVMPLPENPRPLKQAPPPAGGQTSHSSEAAEATPSWMQQQPIGAPAVANAKSTGGAAPSSGSEPRASELRRDKDSDSDCEEAEEEFKRRAVRRQAERRAEEEERNRQQFARAQEKLRQLEQRAEERRQQELEDRRRKHQELRDPRRAGVWDSLASRGLGVAAQASTGSDPAPSTPSATAEGGGKREATSAKPDTGSPSEGASRKLPPAPVEQAPSPPKEGEPDFEHGPPPGPPPGPPSRPSQHPTDHAAANPAESPIDRPPPPTSAPSLAPPAELHSAAFAGEQRMAKMPPTRQPERLSQGPGPTKPQQPLHHSPPPQQQRRSFPGARHTDEYIWEFWRPPPPSVTGHSVWTAGNPVPPVAAATSSPSQSLDVSWPDLDKDPGPQRRKERKQVALSNHLAESEVRSKAIQPWWGMRPPPAGRPVPTGTISLQDLARPMKKGKVVDRMKSVGKPDQNTIVPEGAPRSPRRQDSSPSGDNDDTFPGMADGDTHELSGAPWGAATAPEVRSSAHLTQRPQPGGNRARRIRGSSVDEDYLRHQPDDVCANGSLLRTTPKKLSCSSSQPTLRTAHEEAKELQKTWEESREELCHASYELQAGDILPRRRSWDDYRFEKRDDGSCRDPQRDECEVERAAVLQQEQQKQRGGGAARPMPRGLDFDSERCRPVSRRLRTVASDSEEEDSDSGASREEKHTLRIDPMKPLRILQKPPEEKQPAAASSGSGQKPREARAGSQNAGRVVTSNKGRGKGLGHDEQQQHQWGGRSAGKRRSRLTHSEEPVAAQRDDYWQERDWRDDQPEEQGRRGRSKRNEARWVAKAPAEQVPEADAVDDEEEEDAATGLRSKSMPAGRRVSWEDMERLRPIGDTGLSLGAGIVRVCRDSVEDSDVDEDAQGEEFFTVKTKRQQRNERQEERRMAAQLARRALRREAQRQREEFSRQAQAARAAKAAEAAARVAEVAAKAEKTAAGAEFVEVLRPECDAMSRSSKRSPITEDEGNADGVDAEGQEVRPANSDDKSADGVKDNVTLSNSKRPQVEKSDVPPPIAAVGARRFYGRHGAPPPYKPPVLGPAGARARQAAGLGDGTNGGKPMRCTRLVDFTVQCDLSEEEAQAEMEKMRDSRGSRHRSHSRHDQGVGTHESSYGLQRGFHEWRQHPQDEPSFHAQSRPRDRFAALSSREEGRKQQHPRERSTALSDSEEDRDRRPPARQRHEMSQLAHGRGGGGAASGGFGNWTYGRKNGAGGYHEREDYASRTAPDGRARWRKSGRGYRH